MCEKAAEVLTPDFQALTTQLEQRLLNSDPTETDDPAESRSRLSALTLYYLARSDIVRSTCLAELTFQAVTDANYDLALSMIEKGAGEYPDPTPSHARQPSTRMAFSVVIM